jgi:hypothetical protein
LAAKKLIHELLRLEKNPDLEEKGGNDELKAINEIYGKTRQVEDLSDSSSCRSQKVRKNYLILFGLYGFFEKVFFIPF